MSAFPESGRSDRQKLRKIRSAFGSIPDVPRSLTLPSGLSIRLAGVIRAKSGVQTLEGKTMNWTKASAAAEILSSVAILATLVYLAIEIQQSAEATQANTRQAVLASDQQFLELLIDNPGLNLLWYKPELSDEERIRLSYFLVTTVRMRESNWFQYQNGILDDATWRAYRGSLIVMLSAPQTRVWWQNFGLERIFDPEFISLVHELLANQPVFERSRHIAAFD